MLVSSIIFDLDGVLIDSEPMWGSVEIDAARAVGLELTLEDCRRTRGLRIDEVTSVWWEQSPWHGGTTPLELAERIVDEMERRILADGQAINGAVGAVEWAADHFPLAVASSSPERLIRAALTRLGLLDRFEVVESAQNDRFGKPHPAVFLRAADALGVAPSRCLVVEDSVNGVIAAKSARMQVVALPGADERERKEFVIADGVLQSLRELPAWVEK